MNRDSRNYYRRFRRRNRVADSGMTAEAVDLDHAEYVDALLKEDRITYLNFISDIERKAGIVISSIAIVLSLEVVFLPTFSGLDWSGFIIPSVQSWIGVVMHIIYTLHLLALLGTIIFSALAYSRRKYGIFGSENIARMFSKDMKARKDRSVLQNISNNLFAKEFLRDVINEKSRWASISMGCLIVAGVLLLILLSAVLWCL